MNGKIEYCRICGINHTPRMYPIKNLHAKILHWIHPSYYFDNSNLVICWLCKSRVEGQQKDFYRKWKNPNKTPNKYISVCNWDLAVNRPVFDSEGRPVRPNKGPVLVDGRLRSPMHPTVVVPTAAAAQDQQNNNMRAEILYGAPTSCSGSGPSKVSLRRSSRKKILEQTPLQVIKNNIINEKEDGLMAIDVGHKGLGVIATRNFHKGEYLCEYSGEHMTKAQALKRKNLYAQFNDVGSYIFDYVHDGRRLAVDATGEIERVARYVNHSRKNGNADVKRVALDHNDPRLYLIATKAIEPGEEILYDYNDLSPESLLNNPWLAE